jgi:hypothetical protein
VLIQWALCLKVTGTGFEVAFIVDGRSLMYIHERKERTKY